MSSADIVDYRRIRSARLMKPLIANDDDDPPPRPGGVPMRLRSGHSRPDHQDMRSPSRIWAATEGLEVAPAA